MVVKVTLTKITKAGKITGREQTGEEFLVLQSARLFSGEGAALAIEDQITGIIYQTDFAYSGVAAVLEAAATTGGTFSLT